MPAPTCARPARTGRPPRMRRAPARPSPESARLIVTGAQTGPVQGTGMRNSKSHVPSEDGQPMNAHSHA